MDSVWRRAAPPQDFGLLPLGCPPRASSSRPCLLPSSSRGVGVVACLARADDDAQKGGLKCPATHWAYPVGPGPPCPPCCTAVGFPTTQPTPTHPLLFRSHHDTTGMFRKLVCLVLGTLAVGSQAFMAPMPLVKASSSAAARVIQPAQPETGTYTKKRKRERKGGGMCGGALCLGVRTRGPGKAWTLGGAWRKGPYFDRAYLWHTHPSFPTHMQACACPCPRT